MFKENRGKWHVEHYPKHASRQFTVGMLVTWDGAGRLTPAIAATTAAEIVGICKEAIPASDSSNAEIAVSVPARGARMECNDVNGTITAAMVGKKYNLTNSNEVNVAASTVGTVRLTDRISATKGIFRLAR